MRRLLNLLKKNQVTPRCRNSWKVDHVNVGKQMAGHVAIRTCVVCRSRQAKTALLRLVLRGDLVVEDTFQVLPGRGSYVCQRLECLTQLRCDKRLHRAFRGKARQLAPGIGLRMHLTDPQRKGPFGG